MPMPVAPEGRPTRGTVSATCLSTSGLVAEHVRAFCAISCNGADVQQLRVGPGESEVRQALILPDVVEAFDSFQTHHPAVQISLVMRNRADVCNLHTLRRRPITNA